jgi:hypothetical protein
MFRTNSDVCYQATEPYNPYARRLDSAQMREF